MTVEEQLGDCSFDARSVDRRYPLDYDRYDWFGMLLNVAPVFPLGKLVSSVGGVRLSGFCRGLVLANHLHGVKANPIVLEG